jgi:hypothetical protein
MTLFKFLPHPTIPSHQKHLCMKKQTYLLLTLILLTPFYSFSPSKKAVANRATDTYKYEFAYTVKPSVNSPGQYDITCYFIQFDLTTNTWTNPQSPTSFQISPNVGPLAGGSETYPSGLFNYTFISLPWNPSGDISCTITPTSNGGIPVSQTIIPVSELP